MNLIWFRNDLRIEDNPALYHGCQNGQVCGVYIVTEKQWITHDDALAKIAFWRKRLQALAGELSDKHIALKILNVPTYKDIPDALATLCEQLQITDLWYNHEYPLNEKLRDQAVTERLKAQSVSSHGFHGDVIQAPGMVKTQAKGTFHVFTPFSKQWKKQLSEDHLSPLPAPRKRKTPPPLASDDVDTIWPSTSTYREDIWPSDSRHIHKKLHQFTTKQVAHYGQTRDIPGVAGTSMLSPYLSCGAISARQCLAATCRTTSDWRENAWTNELIWREFYRHLLDAYPHLSQSKDFKAIKQAIPWDDNAKLFSAFCQGETGFPIVDAAIKQLLRTGWMHNRLRMIVAAFLTKLLLIDWRKGEAFFMQHLIDGDYASNNGGWQWSASTGADAAPYFRIFNPQRQSERFDPEGVFIKKFLPELSLLDKKNIHNPNSSQRKACDYPEPIIDYTFARQRALDIFSKSMGK
jgi:deoxyribodipyrimidine photo-lyase